MAAKNGSLASSANLDLGEVLNLIAAEIAESLGKKK
jgi:hypothetical protein